MNILTRINRKDKQSLSKFFEENFSSIVIFIDKYLEDMETAADIAQECFIRLWNTSTVFESEDKVKGFLYVTAKNMALNELKHNKICQSYERQQLLESEEYLIENVFEEEVYAMVYKAIDQLAPQSRQIILLSLQEYSNGEIADQLGISINSVRTLKQNAYKRLKGLLKNHFYLLFLLTFREPPLS